MSPELIEVAELDLLSVFLEYFSTKTIQLLEQLLNVLYEKSVLQV